MFVSPRLGKRVLYTLSEADVHSIGQQRLAAGQSARNGNPVREGDTYFGVIVKDNMQLDLYERVLAGEIQDGLGRVLEAESWMASMSANIQLFLDGNDSYWVTSRSEFIPEQHGRWAREFSKSETPDKSDPADWTPDPKGHFQFIE